MYSLSYNYLAELPSITDHSYLSGSARYVHRAGNIVKKKQYHNHKEIEGGVYNAYMGALKYCQINKFPISPSVLMEDLPHGPEMAMRINQYRRVRKSFQSEAGKINRTYKLNKSKARKRLQALCRLETSRKFLAFYSISFPALAPDSVLYEIFNSWLTNCRKRYGLKTYIWIAERQANGTLHFHLLTVNRMDIVMVNKAMAVAIDNKVKQGLMRWGNSSVDRYNGIDVDCVQRPKKRQGENRRQYRMRLNKMKKVLKEDRLKWLTKYLTKYVTKNDIEFTRLPWHCSRDVSALFTCVIISEKDLHYYTDYLSDDYTEYQRVDKEKVIIYIFKYLPANEIFKMLDKANEMIYFYLNNSPP